MGQPQRTARTAAMWAAIKARFSSMLAYLRSLLWKQEMEITLVGLQNAGKSTLVQVIADGSFQEDMIPTVGFNMRKFTKGKVQIKMWDLGGQPRFRGMWERYCANVSAIVYVVDAADHKQMDTSREELPEEQIIERMHLKDITDREVGFYTISAKNKDDIETTIDWLIQHNAGK